MICKECGGLLEKNITDLPFKVTNESIIIIKKLPVMQCQNCREYLLEDKAMAYVDHTLENVDQTAELEILRYAA